jgi:hypothetical protein
MAYLFSIYKNQVEKYMERVGLKMKNIFNITIYYIRIFWDNFVDLRLMKLE